METSKTFRDCINSNKKAVLKYLSTLDEQVTTLDVLYGYVGEKDIRQVRKALNELLTEHEVICEKRGLNSNYWQLNNKKKQFNRQEIIEFVDWCYSPVYQKRGQLSFERRVVPQAPDHLEFAILDEKGDSLLGKGIFLNSTQLFEYWLNNIKNE